MNTSRVSTAAVGNIEDVVRISLHDKKDTKIKNINNVWTHCTAEMTVNTLIALTNYTDDESTSKYAFDDYKYVELIAWLLNKNLITCKEVDELDDFLYLRKSWGNESCLTSIYGESVGYESDARWCEHFEALPIHLAPLIMMQVMPSHPLLSRWLRTNSTIPDVSKYKLRNLMSTKEPRPYVISLIPSSTFRSESIHKMFLDCIENYVSTRNVEFHNNYYISHGLFYLLITVYEDAQHHSFAAKLLPQIINILDKYKRRIDVNTYSGTIKNKKIVPTSKKQLYEIHNEMSLLSSATELNYGKGRDSALWYRSLNNKADEIEVAAYRYWWHDHWDLIAMMLIRGLVLYHAPCENCLDIALTEEEQEHKKSMCSFPIHRNAIHPIKLLEVADADSFIYNHIIRSYTNALLAAKESKKISCITKEGKKQKQYKARNGREYEYTFEYELPPKWLTSIELEKEINMLKNLLRKKPPSKIGKTSKK